MRKHSTKALAGFVSLFFTYYILTTFFANAIYLVDPTLAETVNMFAGVFALLYIIATFILAWKERNWKILGLFILLLMFIGYALWVGGYASP